MVKKLSFFWRGLNSFLGKEERADSAPPPPSPEKDLLCVLKARESEARALINAVPDVIFETDEKGHFAFLNESWTRITNADIQDSLGKSIFSFLDKQDQEKAQEGFHELIRGQRQAFHLETQLTVGTISFAAEVSFSLLRVSEKNNLRIVGTISNIERRRQAELGLRAAEQRYRDIVENSISGIYQSTPEGRFISANPAMAEVLGYESPDDLIESVTDIPSQLYVVPEEHKKLTEELLVKGRLAGFELELRRKDGKRIWVLQNARVVRDSSGAVQYYEGSISDVTERRAVDESMRHAHLQAEISSRSRMEFLANISHEIRTPLNSIIGFSEILKDEVLGPLGNSDYKEYAKDIYESGHTLLTTIGEILEVSRIETGQRDLKIGNFPLKRAAKACLSIMEGRIKKAGLHVEKDIPDDLPDLLAEELAFKQILLNLLSNALKFTPSGGTITISARLNEETGGLWVDVKDTGHGMSPDEVGIALQPFGQVNRGLNCQGSGTGLGLTIVNSLVKLHGGGFELLSKKGQGTTARIHLPKESLFYPEKDGNVVKIKR